jgi:hypothetical protein
MTGTCPLRIVPPLAYNAFNADIEVADQVTAFRVIMRAARIDEPLMKGAIGNEIERLEEYLKTLGIDAPERPEAEKYIESLQALEGLIGQTGK